MDRQRTKEVTSESTTDTALAELYAQVQAMPESAQKKRLISKLNDANGYGTPKVLKPLSSKHNVHVAETFENIKSWITPRSHRKNVSTVNKGGSNKKSTKKEKPIGRSGSYSLKHQKNSGNMALNEHAAPHSFRRCVSVQQEESGNRIQMTHLAAPLPANVVRPNQEAKFTTTAVIQIETPGSVKRTGGNDLDDVCLPPPLSTVSVRSIQRRAPPPVPQRVSSLKPKCDTPKSPFCDSSSGKEHVINGVDPTSGVSSTPLPSGLLYFIINSYK